MKVRFLPVAEAEFIRELVYYSKARPGTAAKFEASVEAAAQLAMRYPQGGAPSCNATRTYRVKGFPFSLVYRELQQEVLVVAIAAHRKRPNYWASRADA